MNVASNIDFGDEKVFKDTFDDYYHPLCFYAARILGEDYLAYDLVQEVFLRLWERGMTFDNVCAMKGYLYSSVYNACLNRRKSIATHLKHHTKIKSDGERNTPEELPWITDRIEAEVFSEIFRAIEELPSECRRIFKLSYMEGLSVEAVGEKLGISVNTVKTQRSRARKLLKETLKDLYIFLLLAFLHF